MVTLNFKCPVDSSRGRNGFFKAVRAVVWRFDDPGNPNVCVDLYSKRVGGTAPAIMRISHQDAIRLGHLLVAAGMGRLEACEPEP